MQYSTMAWFVFEFRGDSLIFKYFTLYSLSYKTEGGNYTIIYAQLFSIIFRNQEDLRYKLQASNDRAAKFDFRKNF